MNNELINLCNQKVSEYDELIKNINKKINRLKPIYDKLCPKGKTFDSNNETHILKVCDDYELIDKMYDILKDNCPFLLDVMIQNQQKYEEYSEYTDKELLKRGLTKETIYNEAFLESLKRSAKTDFSIRLIYNKILKMKETDQKLIIRRN